MKKIKYSLDYERELHFKMGEAAARRQIRRVLVPLLDRLLVVIKRTPATTANTTLAMALYEVHREMWAATRAPRKKLKLL